MLGNDEKYRGVWGGGGGALSFFVGSMTAYVPSLLISQECSGTGNTSELVQEKTPFAI
jgi:hypothetical protein